MDKLIIPATDDSPGVVFDQNKDSFVIYGNSHPENSALFYQPLMDWVDEYFKYKYWRDDQEQRTDIDIVFEFKLDYFSSSSAKCILDLLAKIDNTRKKETGLSIKWYYDDVDMKEAGEEIAEMTGLPLQVVPNN